MDTTDIFLIIIPILIVLIMILLFVNYNTPSKSVIYVRPPMRYRSLYNYPVKSNKDNTLLDLTTDNRARGMVHPIPGPIISKTLFNTLKSQGNGDKLDRVQTNITSDTMTPIRHGIGQYKCVCLGGNVIKRVEFEK